MHISRKLIPAPLRRWDWETLPNGVTTANLTTEEHVCTILVVKPGKWRREKLVLTIRSRSTIYSDTSYHRDLSGAIEHLAQHKISGQKPKTNEKSLPKHQRAQGVQ